MSVARVDRSGCTVLVVRGELDMAVEGRLFAAAVTVLQEHARHALVLDMSGLGFMASIGISELIMIQYEAVTCRRRLRIIVGGNRQLQRVLAAVGLDRRLPICASIEEALAGGGAQSTA